MSHLHRADHLTSVLGQDFGNLYSKMSLGFTNQKGDLEVSRVVFSGDLSDPDYPETNSQYDFVASAALTEDGKLVEGRPALNYDEAIPLKTMLVWVAKVGPRDETVNRLPFGECLVASTSKGDISKDDIKLILRCHWTRLRRMALAHATGVGVVIDQLVLTYPNYLFMNENSKDFDRYIDYYITEIRLIWGSEINIRVMSEGQAITIYACEPFFDSEGGAVRRLIENLFADMEKRSWIKLVIVDSGSSSVVRLISRPCVSRAPAKPTQNIQTVCIYFDEHGQMSHSQSFINPGQRAGVQSGSHMANDEVQKILSESLKSAENAGTSVKPGDLAKYLEAFERTKRSRNFNYLEYIRSKRELRLSTDDGCQLRIDLDHRQIEKVFNTAHKKGLDILESEIGRSADNDTATLFTGGSYLSKGLRTDVMDKMENISSKAAEHGTKVTYDFLGNHGTRWSTAVSAGAAIGLMTMPSLDQTLVGFTIGLQVIRRRTTRKSRSHWTGDGTAAVLFSQGVVSQRHVDHFIPMGGLQFSRLRFRLVCDPTYTKHREDRELSSEFVPPIQIEYPREIRGPKPYDMGCEITPSDLPAGTVRFVLEGPGLSHAAEGRFAEAIVADYLPVVLRCFSVDVCGNMREDPHNKRFLLRVKTDAASRFPIVANEDDFYRLALPFSCTYCPEEVESVCQDCKNSLCSSCIVCHTADHVLNPIPPGFF